LEEREGREGCLEEREEREGYLEGREGREGCLEGREGRDGCLEREGCLEGREEREGMFGGRGERGMFGGEGRDGKGVWRRGKIGRAEGGLRRGLAPTPVTPHLAAVWPHTATPLKCSSAMCLLRNLAQVGENLAHIGRRHIRVVCGLDCDDRGTLLVSTTCTQKQEILPLMHFTCFCHLAKVKCIDVNLMIWGKIFTPHKK
jgi:hypothetical protein